MKRVSYDAGGAWRIRSASGATWVTTVMNPTNRAGRELLSWWDTGTGQARMFHRQGTSLEHAHQVARRKARAQELREIGKFASAVVARATVGVQA